MMILRPVKRDDLQLLKALAGVSSIGLTSLPKSEEGLAAKIEGSLKAFDKKNERPHSDQYIFVLEDLVSKQIVGTCGIKAQTAVKYPTYRFRKSKDRHTRDILETVEHRMGPSEICGLYLHPEFRKTYLGTLLSYSRFLFMATHQTRFTETVFAEMRGYFDDNNDCPFWNGVGRKFYDVDFERSVELRLGVNDFVDRILPEYPLYIDLLPQEVQDVIGKPHPNTEAAVKLLQQIGFQLMEEVDLFDAGPNMIAPLIDVVPYRDCEMLPIVEIKALAGKDNWIVLSQSLDVRACLARCEKKENGLVLDESAAEQLRVAEGEHVSFYHLKKQHS